MKKQTIREQIEPYIKQGMSVMQIRDVTGLRYKAIYNSIYAEKRNANKKAQKKLNTITSENEKPNGWFKGWNDDRKKCKTCKYRSYKTYLNKCDYIEHEKRSRNCKVSDCDKYVRGKRLRINEKGGWNAKGDDCFVD